VRKPRIGITVGDPAGIGPEISLKAAADPRVVAACEPILYGPHNPDALAPFVPGRLSADAGRAAFQAIAEAVEHVRLRRIDAIRPRRSIRRRSRSRAFLSRGTPICSRCSRMTGRR